MSNTKAYNRAYYEANKEAIAERKRIYYQANKAAFAERSRGNYQENRKDILEQQKSYCLSTAGKFKQMKANARARGKGFDLSYEFYESQLWGKPCHYCGVQMEVTGLDRKDSDKGYTADNVVPACRSCNIKKFTKPYEQFIAEVENEKRNG